MSYWTGKGAEWLMAACVSLLVPVRATGPALRVIGGRDAHVGEYPYVVQVEMHVDIQIFIDKKYVKTIQLKPYPSCTASVLTATWALTAAHCCEETTTTTTTTVTNRYVTEMKYFIRYGFPLGKASENDSFSRILKNVMPTKSRLGKYVGMPTDDIALYNTEPILIDQYAKISAIEYPALFGHEVTLAGYGKMKSRSSTLNLPFILQKPLQVMKAMLIRCNEATYPSMCVMPACGVTQTVAPGDSGSAVLHLSGVVGVMSKARYPTFQEHLKPPSYIPSKLSVTATPISLYVDWIINIINEKS